MRKKRPRLKERFVGDTPPGEWKALLAPMTTAGSAENIVGFVVITVHKNNDIEMHTNGDDEKLRALLEVIRP